MSDSIGKRIKNRREELGYTLEELAGKVGVGTSTVRKWEIGYIKDMRSDKIQKVARALELTPAYLMGWEENQNINIEQVRTNNGLIGQANAPVHINADNSSNTAMQLSKEEAELLRIYDALGVKRRMKLLTFAMSLETEEQEL